MTRLSFPPYWHYDVLRGLDYFQSADALDDGRLADAIDLLGDRRLPDGRWPLQQRHPGAVWFEIGTHRLPHPMEHPAYSASPAPVESHCHPPRRGRDADRARPRATRSIITRSTGRQSGQCGTYPVLGNHGRIARAEPAGGHGR